MAAHGWRQLPAICKAVLYVKVNVLLAGFRGTLLTDTQNMADDVALVTGSEGSRDRSMQAMAWVKSLARAYPACKLMLVGNSLGGSLCLSTRYKVPAVTASHCYNAFAFPTIFDHIARS